MQGEKSSTKMVLVKGKISYYPSTLNNQIHTYFLADHWARSNIEGDHLCTAQNWLAMVKSVSQLNHDYNKFIGEKLSKFYLFNTWGLYGDGMCLVELFAIGEFDPEKDDEIKIYNQEQKYRISSKLGQHKSAISDSDTDCQDSTRWFGLELQIQKEKSFFKFNQTSIKHFSKRVLTEQFAAASAMRGDWFFIGNRFRYQNSDNLLNDPKKVDGRGQLVFLRLDQFRYNMQSKVSNGVGYYAHTNILSNDPNMHGWRRIYYKQPTDKYPFAFLFKSTKKGLLLDLASAILDTNDKVKNPLYPKKFSIKLFYESNKEAIIDYNNKNATKDLQTINSQQAGLVFFKGIKQLRKQIIILQFSFQFSKQEALQLGNKSPLKYNYTGIETQYHIHCPDTIKKSKITEDRPIFHQQYINQADFQIFCTRFGQPFTGKVDLTLTCNDWHDKRGIATSKELQKSFDQALKVQLFRKKYKSYDYIKQKIYFGKIEIIQELAEMLESRMIFVEKSSQQSDLKKEMQFLKQKNQKEVIKTSIDVQKSKNEFHQDPINQDQYNTHWRVMLNGKPTEDYFLLKFLKTEKNILEVSFQKGRAIVTMRLNIPLTPDNNPRRPAFNSLASSAYLLVNQQKLQLGDSTRIYGVFSQTGQRLRQKSQWVSNIGLTLKKFALLYPSMQKIANIYDFQGLKMPALRRAFDVQDQNNTRYMPSTRQLSFLEHREIRRWMYEPIYNSTILPYGKEKYRELVKNLMVDKSQNLQKPLHSWMGPQNLKLYKSSEMKKQFYKIKRQLIHDLRKAFKIQLITVPLYLSAMFSVNPSCKAHQIIRQIARDEMKHLFIMSNILNSVFDSELFDYKKAIPYTNTEFLPSYPVLNKDLPGIFQTKDPDLQKILAFDIQPCSNDQILKFAFLQIPGQLDNLIFQYNQSFEGLENTMSSVRVNKLNSYLQLLKNQIKINKNFITIGQAYSNIIQKFWFLHDLEDFINKNSGEKSDRVKVFTGDISKQFTFFDLENMDEVYDLKSALTQLRLIVQEGEGANLLTIKQQGQKQSHFLKFVQIYTGCKIVKTQTINLNQKHEKKDVEQKETKHTEIIIKIYLEHDAQKAVQLINDQERWNKITDKKIEKQISKEFEGQSVKQDSSRYTDAYAKQALKNSYKGMLRQLDYIFNTGFEDFYSLLKQQKIEEKQAKILFEKARRAKMQESIASMRRVRLHADKVIRYARSSDGPSCQRQLGSRPNFNIDIDENFI